MDPFSRLRASAEVGRLPDVPPRVGVCVPSGVVGARYDVSEPMQGGYVAELGLDVVTVVWRAEACDQFARCDLLVARCIGQRQPNGGALLAGHRTLTPPGRDFRTS
jgi:hypothetical protein